MENQDRPLLEAARRYGFIQHDEVWLHAIPALGHPARRVGAVRNSEDDSLLYFARRFQTQYAAKVEDLLRRYAAADNKGSYLMKIQHLKSISGSFDAIGDYEMPWLRLTAVEEEILDSVGVNRERNLGIRIELIEKARAIQDSDEWSETTEHLRVLRDQWVQTGSADKELTTQLEDLFQAALTHFHTRKKSYYKSKHQQQNRAKEKYKALINESNRLKESTDWENTTRRLKQIQNDWKEVGGGLSRKLANEMWLRLRMAHNHYFERLQKHIAEQRVLNPPPSPDEILERKRGLVRQATALLEVVGPDAIVQTKELQNKWKTSGTVRGPESDRVWEAFVVACDQVFEQSALEHHVRRQYPDLAQEPVERQLSLRLEALHEFVAADEAEQLTLRAALEALPATADSDATRTTLTGKLRALGRKIRSKQELMDVMRARYVVA